MALALIFTDDDFDETNRTVYTFSAVAIGAAAANRIVVVDAHADEGGDLVSMTIGGISATIAVSAAATDEFAVIAYAVVPTGTTADIVVTWTSGALRCMIGAWRLTGATTTPTDTDSSNSIPSTGESLTVNIPTNAAAIAAHTSNQNSSTDFWTGAAQRYKDPSSNSEFQGADTQPTGSDRATHTISTSYSSLSAGAALVGAVWVDSTKLVVSTITGIGTVTNTIQQTHQLEGSIPLPTSP